MPTRECLLAPLGPDGIFGAKTAKRVVEFQSKNGLVVDGVVGHKTEGMLNVLLGNPTHFTPEHVSPAQKKAAAKSFDAGHSTSIPGKKSAAKMFR